MSWSSLTPTPASYGAHLSFLVEYIDEYNDGRSAASLETASEVTEIFLVEAKAEALRDLQSAFGLNPDAAADLAVLDEIVETQPTRLRNAVALLQLALAFEATSHGEESRNERLAQIYRRRYDAERKGFPTLVRRQGRSTTVARRIGL